MEMENGKFLISVYRKENFNGVYTNFTSFIPLEYKFRLPYTLFRRCFCLVSNFSKFHIELEKLSFLSKNTNLQKFIDKCIFK